MFYVIGLGNPGEEYENTRHNTGRMSLLEFVKQQDFPELEYDKKSNALVSEGKIGREKIIAVAPETFMNKSGDAVKKFIKSQKAASQLIVIHDDLDIPFGKMRVSFNKSSGGHRGVESVIRAIKTEAFTRVRVGIAPTTAAGKIKKPVGEQAVVDFILAKFKPAETTALKKVLKNAAEAVATIVGNGKEKAMGKFNSV